MIALSKRCSFLLITFVLWLPSIPSLFFFTFYLALTESTYWKLTQANIMQNTFWIMNGLYVYTVCSKDALNWKVFSVQCARNFFPLFFPRGLAQIEFDLGPRTVRVSMASKRFAIYWRERESLWDWTCIQNLKMICNQKHLHSTYLCTVCTYH